jgi:hypothetical protein
MAAAQTAHLQAARPVPTLREAYPHPKLAKEPFFAKAPIQTNRLKNVFLEAKN